MFLMSECRSKQQIRFQKSFRSRFEHSRNGVKLYTSFHFVFFLAKILSTYFLFFYFLFFFVVRVVCVCVWYSHIYLLDLNLKR